MLENILGLVKEFAGNEISNNVNIPDNQKDAVLQTAMAAVAGSLKDHATSGDLSGLTSLLSSGVGASGSSSLLGGIQESVVTALSEKLGINPVIANGIAASIVPSILNGISNKVQDPNDSQFNVESVLGALTGGGKGAGGLMGMIGGLFGK